MLNKTPSGRLRIRSCKLSLTCVWGTVRRDTAGGRSVSCAVIDTYLSDAFPGHARRPVDDDDDLTVQLDPLGPFQLGLNGHHRTQLSIVVLLQARQTSARRGDEVLLGELA